MATKVRKVAIRADPYTNLTSSDATVRLKTATALVSDLAEILKKSKGEDDCDSNGVSKHLRYALDRSIKGLESFEQYARVGFSTALTLLIEQFDVTTELIEELANRRYEYSSSLASNEVQYFDLGWCFLAQCLIRSQRILQISPAFLQKLMKCIVRLQAQHKQMGELVCETIVILLEVYSKSPAHFIHVKDAAQEIVPKNTDNCKPHHISVILALRRIGHESLLAADLFNPLNAETWHELFAILDTALHRFPMIPSVWEHLLRSYMSLSTKQFSDLWLTYIIPRYATTFHYNKKGLALELCALALRLAREHYEASIAKIGTELDAINSSRSTLSTLIKTILQPAVIKLLIGHIREFDMPLRPHAVALHDAIEGLAKAVPHTVADLLAILSNPSAGGHRFFDAKSHTHLCRTLVTFLSMEDLRNLIHSSIETFNNAKAHATADVRLAAESAREYGEQKKRLAQETVGKDLEQQDADEKALNADEIGDIDEFLTTEPAVNAIAKQTHTLREWVADHLLYFGDLLLSRQKHGRAAAKALARAEDKMDDEDEDVSEDDEKRSTSAKGKGNKKRATKAKPETQENTSKQQRGGRQTQTNVVPLTEEIEELNMQCFKDALQLLYRHAFFVANEDKAQQPPAKAPTAKSRRKTAAAIPQGPAIIVHDVSPRCRQLCTSRYLSLLQNLFIADAYTRSEIGSFEARWFETIAAYDLEVQKDTKAVVAPKQDDELSDSFALGSETLALLAPLHSEGQQIPRAIAFILTCALAIARAEPGIVAPLIPDICEIANRVVAEAQPKRGRQSAKQQADDDMPWIDVLMDVLFSILGYGGAMVRSVIVKVFRAVCERVEMSSIHDLISTLVKAQDDEEMADDEGEDDASDDNSKQSKAPRKRSAPSQDDDSSDDDVFQVDNDSDDEEDDDEDDEGEEDDGAADFGRILREALAERQARQSNRETSKKARSADDNEEDDDEDEDDEDLEELTMDALSDLLLDSSASVLPEFQTRAIQGIVKLRKDRSRQHQNKQQQELALKLRILDLIEIIIEKIPFTNAWLSLFMPLAVLVTSHRNEASKPLHTRAFNVFNQLLCKRLVFSADPIVLSKNTPDQDLLLGATDACNGTNIQAVLLALFESAKTSNSHEGVAMATNAISTLGTLYLSAPASAGEMEPFTQATPETETKRRTTRRKTVAPAPTIDEDAVRTSVYDARVQWVSTQFALALETYFSKTRHILNHRFFEEIIQRVPHAVWAVKPIDILIHAYNNAPSVFLRCEALEFLMVAVRSRRGIPPQTLGNFLTTIYKTIYESETLGELNQEHLKKENSTKVRKNFLKCLHTLYLQLLNIIKVVNTTLDEADHFVPVPISAEKRQVLARTPVKKTKDASTSKQSPDGDEDGPEGSTDAVARKPSRKRRRKGAKKQKGSQTAAKKPTNKVKA